MATYICIYQYPPLLFLLLIVIAETIRAEFPSISPWNNSNNWNLQTHKSIIQNLNVASKIKASKTKPLVQTELLLFVYMHCNTVLYSHMHLLCKVPFYKIFLFNAFDDHTQKLKNFHCCVYPHISVLELDVCPTQVRLWTVHSVSHPTQCSPLQQKNGSLFTFTIPQNSSPALSEVGNIVSPYLLMDNKSWED